LVSGQASWKERETLVYAPPFRTNVRNNDARALADSFERWGPINAFRRRGFRRCSRCEGERPRLCFRCSRCRSSFCGPCASGLMGKSCRLGPFTLTPSNPFCFQCRHELETACAICGEKAWSGVHECPRCEIVICDFSRRRLYRGTGHSSPLERNLLAQSEASGSV